MAWSWSSKRSTGFIICCKAGLFLYHTVIRIGLCSERPTIKKVQIVMIGRSCLFRPKLLGCCVFYQEPARVMELGWILLFVGGTADFIPELALQRIEAQHNLTLSRQLGTPNIASKGKLSPRTALVPLALFPASHSLRVDAEKSQKKFIEEVDTSSNGIEKSSAPNDSAKPKGILKNSIAKENGLGKQERPQFEWSKEDGHIKVTLQVPELVGTVSLVCRRSKLTYVCGDPRRHNSSRPGRRAASNHSRYPVKIPP